MEDEREYGVCGGARGERRDQLGCTGACNQQLAESNGVTCRYSCLMALVNIEGQVLGPRVGLRGHSVEARSLARTVFAGVERHARMLTRYEPYISVRCWPWKCAS